MKTPEYKCKYTNRSSRDTTVLTYRINLLSLQNNDSVQCVVTNMLYCIIVDGMEYAEVVQIIVR